MNKKPQIKKGTVKRLLSYIKNGYTLKFVFVFVCIIVSSIAGVFGTVFLQSLIDDYITPLLEVQNPVYTELFHAITILASIYIVGVIAGYIYNRFMAVIAQGVLKNIRDDMFNKMEKLPIRYFDTHAHGDIMSRYTNDTDALEMMISQSIPQIINCIFTIIASAISMIYLSPFLTLFVFIFTLIILKITKTIASKSSKHFIGQQKSIGAVNGYIEEMLNGQKVIKVFTHEEKAKEEFDKLNDKLNDDMFEANRYANIMMPVANNLGNLQYVFIAIIGTLLALSGNLVLTVRNNSILFTTYKKFFSANKPSYESSK